MPQPLRRPGVLLVALVALGATTGTAGSVGSLPFFYDLYTFRGAEGTTVVASIAVPVGKLGTEREDGGIRYRFDVTLVVADTAAGTVARADDSVYVSLPQRLSDDHLLHTFVQVEAAPSPTTLQRLIMTDAAQPGVGQLYSTPFPVRDYSGPRLMLSDIALGVPHEDAGWSRGDATVALLPSSQFQDGRFDVYYEIYNLPGDTRYSTDLIVEEVDEDGHALRDAPSPVATRYSGESKANADGVVAELRRVATSLSKGYYRLTVVVTDDDTGRTARRQRLFRVRGEGEGATLVPAHPAKRQTPPIG